MVKKRLGILLAAVLVILVSACTRTPPPTTAELVDKATGFTTVLAGKEYDQAVGYFDKTMKKILPAEQLQEAWEQVLLETGDYRSIAGTRTEQLPDNEVVYVTAQFARTNYDLKVVFDRSGRIAGLFFLPIAQLPPVSPDAFREADVTVGSGEWALPGTLTLPQGNGPFPGVVLVHGSGPNDRDETIGPNKPFRDLAWELGARGIGVLRYDKRTRVYQTKVAGDYSFTVKEETVDDAVLAAALLASHPEIDPDRVYVLGHSLGATLIPRIGAAAPGVRGFVVMAAIARPLEEVMLEQYHYLFSRDGQISAEEEKTLRQVNLGVEKIKGLSAEGKALRELILGAPAAYWLDLRGYNPAEAAKALRRPLLILQGERDYQVTMVDFDLWQEALQALPEVEFRSYPGLNHLFLAGEGQPNPEEYNRPGNVDARVISDIAAWIKAR